MGGNSFFLESGVTLCLKPRVLGLRLIVFQLARSFVQVRLKGTLIQLKELLTFANVLSFFKKDLLDLPAHLRADLHSLVRFHVADGMDLNGNISLLNASSVYERIVAQANP